MVGVRRFELLTSSTAGTQDKNEDASAALYADGSTQGIDVNGENDLSPRIISVDENGNIGWNPDLANQTTARTTTSSSALSGLLALREGCRGHPGHRHPPREQRPAHRDHLRDCSLLWTRRVCAGPYLYKPFNKHEAIANYARLKLSPTKAQLAILASSAVRN